VKFLKGFGNIRIGTRNKARKLLRLVSGSEFWGWLSGSQGEDHWWSLGALKHFNL